MDEAVLQGRTHLEEGARCSRPSDSITDENIAPIHMLLNEDVRFTLTKLAMLMPLHCRRWSIGTIMQDVKGTENCSYRNFLSCSNRYGIAGDLSSLCINKINV